MGDHPWYDVRHWGVLAKALLVGALVVIVVLAVVLPVVLTRDNKCDNNNSNSDDIPIPPTGEALFASTAAVSADHPTCSTMGKDILLQGGHAADAAVTVALCLGVLNSFASGIGGGGVMMIYTNDGTGDVDSNTEIIDMRETAPAASTQDMYYANTQLSVLGPLAGGIPGEIKGLYTAWQRHGKLAWGDIVMPVANLAQEFTVGELLAEHIEQYQNDLLKNPDLTDVYAPGGVLLSTGDTCRNPKLAQTLTILAIGGEQAFYNGDLGRQFANDVQAAGGIITFEDLQNYSVIIRQPVSTYFLGHKVVLAPAPYGGQVIGQSLNVLERYYLDKLGVTTDAMHWLIESLKLGFANRLAMGDPDFTQDFNPQSNITEQMLSKDHASFLRQRLNITKTFPPNHYIDLSESIHAFEDHGTTHISIVDGERNAVSFTTTVNLQFGARWVSPSTGIILNDEMNDFAVSNVSNNDWGLAPSISNNIVPGKRPLSSMSPTMVFKDNKLYMVAGANGGPRIITSTLQTILNVLGFGKNLYEAVVDPRFHIQFTPPVVFHETDMPTDLVVGLQAKGNTLTALDYRTAVQAVQVQDDNTLLAMADPRKLGKPDGY